MAKKVSINESIFFALKNSETSGVPVLLIGSAGTGKSTTVEMFAEIRGYELLLLRGSTASEQEIMGFMSVHQGEKEVTATNVLPTWFLKMKEYQKAGKKTLLFLDEITAVNPYVQAALLHLIFERKVNEEKIPDDTLIVSAGNYSGNLTNEFELLSPVVNRFCVFNIVPNEDFLDEFLRVYDGAGTKRGTRDILKEKAKVLALMDSQAIKMSDGDKEKAANCFETAIRETTRMLINSGDKPYSPYCSDTQSVYKSQENDELLRGFVSPRSLSYLTRMALASYLNFGEEGIKGSNFKHILEGLVGVSLSRNSGDLVITKVADYYYQGLVQSLSSVAKLSNSKMSSYEEFFKKVVIDSNIPKTGFEAKDITLLTDKLNEMKSDPEVASFSKLLEDDVVTKVLETLTKTLNALIRIKINPKDGDIKNALSPEVLSGIITRWNSIHELSESVCGIVKSGGDSYSSSIKTMVSDYSKNKLSVQMKISAWKKLTLVNFPEFSTLLPDIHGQQ